MNYKMMGRFLSQTLFVELLFMVPALLISLFSGEGDATRALALTIVITAVPMIALSLACKGAPNALSAKEGCTPRALDYHKVQDALKDYGAQLFKEDEE